MLRRFICAALVKNFEGKILLCKAHPEYGVFPNQWAFPGGGMEENETLEDAVRREVREEVGLELESFQPFMFADDFRVKRLRDGSSVEVYMVYLIFISVAKNPEAVVLNDEFVEHKWVDAQDVLQFDLNEPARTTFHALFHEHPELAQ